MTSKFTAQIETTFNGEPLVGTVSGELDYDGDGYAWSYSVDVEFAGRDLGEIEDEDYDLYEEVREEAIREGTEQAGWEADMEDTYRSLRWA